MANITLSQLRTAAERTAETRVAWLEGFEKAVGNRRYSVDIDNATASGRYCERRGRPKRSPAGCAGG